MTAELGEGRHGPVFLGVDTTTQQQVVIRTFVVPMTPDGRERFLDALARLCDMPLDHAAIASPLACGDVDGVPFLVHQFMPGLPLDEYLRQHGRRSLADVSLRVTHLAGAIDFAAAAGVVHGSLGPRDLLLEDERTGISGFGIAQALHEAGVEPRRPDTADDLYALAAMTYEMLVGERYEGGDVRTVLRSLPLGDGVDMERLGRTLQDTLSPDPAGWPASALQFAAALHDARLGPAGPASARAGADQAGADNAGADNAGAAAVSRESLAAPAPGQTTPFELAADPPAGSAPGGAPAVEEAAVEPDSRPVAAALPLFDAPMRDVGLDAPMRAFTAAAPDQVDDDIALRDEEPAIPLHPPRAYLAPGAFAGPPPRSAGSGRLIPLVAGAGLLAALAVFLLFGRPPLLDSRSTDPVPSRESAEAHASTAPGTDVESPASAADAMETTPGLPGPGIDSGPFASPPPVLSDGPIGEREVASLPPDATREIAPQEPPAPARPSPAPSAAPLPATVASAAPPAGVRARAPDPAPAEVTGRLLVRSDPPGAQVVVNDEPRGQTPVAIRDLAFGTHTITVSAPGLPVWRQQVTLSADRPSQSFEIALAAAAARPPDPPPAPAAAATLEVESRPTGAQVWVDGRLVGTTPLQLSGVEEGSRAVRLELPGYRPWTTSVSVARGARARVAASLEQ